MWKFEDFLRDGVCTTVQNDWVFGDQSSFSEILKTTDCDLKMEMMERLVPTPSYSTKLREIPAILSEAADYFSRSLSKEGTDTSAEISLDPRIRHPVDEIIYRLAGLKAAIAVSQYYCHNRGDAEESTKLTIEKLDRRLGSKQQVFHEFIQTQLRSANVSDTSPGYWMTWDACHLAVFGDVPTSTFRATSPVLVVEKIGKDKNGNVMWLVVDLFKRQSPVFYPDVSSLGLTCIVSKSSNTCFYDAMQTAWQSAKLGDAVRGRWSLKSAYVGPEIELREKKNTDVSGEPIHLPSIQGRSAEAACLAAIWAANGVVPYQNEGGPLGDGRESLRLVPHAVVSATIVDDPNATGCDIAVGKVDSVGTKLNGALNFKLASNGESLFDTVLVSTADFDESTHVQQTIDEAIRNAPPDKPYQGITIQEVQNMGQVMDWLLEVNRWMRAWGDQISDKWLQQWDVYRDEDGSPIPIELDGQPLEEVNTGSIEFMRWAEAEANRASGEEESSPRDETDDLE